MSELSLTAGNLTLSLDKAHRNSLILSFLRRIGFREENGIFLTRRTDAEIILRVMRYFQNRNFQLDLDNNCRQAIQERENLLQHFEDLREQARTTKDREDAEIRQDELPPCPEFQRELLPEQRKPVLHGFNLENSANFSVPGSGKTWMAYATYFMAKEAEAVNRLLVVCPQAGLQVWEEEYNLVTNQDPAENVHRITPNDMTLGRMTMLPNNFEVLLINYEKFGRVDESGNVEGMRYMQALKRMLEQENYNFYLIVDESHKIKSAESNRGIAASELAPSAIRRMILSGSPMPNFHRDLWNQFNFLYPDQIENILGGYDAYCAWIGPRRRPNMAARREAVRRLYPYFTRITKDQLHLGPVEFNYLHCPMTEHQKDIYEIIAWQIAQEGNEEKYAAYADFEQIITYWIMASTDPALFFENNQYSDELIDLNNVELEEKIRLYGDGELSGKLSVLQQLLPNFINRQEKIIIWCNFRGTLVKVQQMIEDDFGVEVRKIDGSIDKDDAVNPLVNKERNLREFRTCDDVNILIANPASLAESVSLHQVCHRAIYVDRTYVATNWIQSKERIHRVNPPQRSAEWDGITRYTILTSKYPVRDPPDNRRTVDDMIEDSLSEKERAMNVFLNDPGINAREMELNYDRINDPNDVEEDYRRVIEFLKDRFSNGQNN